MRDCCFKCLAVRLKSVLCVGGKTARCQLQHPVPVIVLWEGKEQPGSPSSHGKGKLVSAVGQSGVSGASGHGLVNTISPTA